MTSRRFVVWDEVGREVQLAQWREALGAAAGNISRAGTAMGFTKSYAMRLTRSHGLNLYAAELRREAIGRSHGRPPEKVPKTGVSRR
jgi:hypothetical protein